MTSRSLLTVAAALAVAAAAPSQTAPCWEAGFGTNLNLGDDQVVNQVLGFTFPGPAGPVTQIGISSNGFVWLTPNTSSGCCSGTSSGMTSGSPRIAPLWTDLNPRAGGGVFFRSGTPSRSARRPGPGRWWGVPSTCVSRTCRWARRWASSSSGCSG